jgi:hypothetical protein
MQGSHREEASDCRLVDLIAGVGVHDAAALMTKMRSATSSTKLETCSQTTMQMFLMLRISRRRRAKSLMIDWIPSVGSSSSSTFGSLASARAIANCCC